MHFHASSGFTWTPKVKRKFINHSQNNISDCTFVVLQYYILTPDENNNLDPPKSWHFFHAFFNVFFLPAKSRQVVASCFLPRSPPCWFCAVSRCRRVIIAGRLRVVRPASICATQTNWRARKKATTTTIITIRRRQFPFGLINFKTTNVACRWRKDKISELCQPKRNGGRRQPFFARQPVSAVPLLDLEN